jgi:hypothetical protein
LLIRFGLASSQACDLLPLVWSNDATLRAADQGHFWYSTLITFGRTSRPARIRRKTQHSARSFKLPRCLALGSQFIAMPARYEFCGSRSTLHYRSPGAQVPPQWP